jgi:hypothetical protein
MYLLNALAEEENQGERLTHMLSGLQAQIDGLEANDSSPNARRLRQQVKALRSKMGACQHRERALAANLANVVVQIEGMKRYQWRNAHQEYAMQIQQAQHHAQMVLMSPARPQFALRSPGFMDPSSQMQYLSLGQSPGNQLLYSSPSAASYLPVPYPGYAPMGQLYSSASPVLRNLEAVGELEQQYQDELDELLSPLSGPSPTSSSYSSRRSYSPRTPRGEWQRARSLLVSSHSSTSGGYSFSPVKPRNEGTLRRLSLLDGTSAAVQLERKAAEARARGSNEES